MSTLNKVMLIGYVGKDPEIRYTAAEMPMINISLATQEKVKDKETGGYKKNTEWHKIVFFGKLVEIAQQYLTKGSKIYIEGNLRTSEYIDKTGIRKFNTSIIARELIMLDKKTNDNSQQKSKNEVVKDVESYDDDIPF